MNAAFGEYERPYMGRGRPSPYDRPRGTRMRSGRFLGRGSGMGGGYGRGRGGYGEYIIKLDHISLGQMFACFLQIIILHVPKVA